MQQSFSEVIFGMNEILDADVLGEFFFRMIMFVIVFRLNRKNRRDRIRKLLRDMERLPYPILSVNNEDQVGRNWWNWIELKRGCLDSSQYPSKSGSKGLSVLGYDNVKSAPIHPKVRQELEYIDREVRKRPIFLFSWSSSSFSLLGSSSYHCSSNGYHQKTRYTFARSRTIYR